MISINNVSKTFLNKKTKIEAVKNISFEISGGEVLGIIGPNGAGKSTLLRMISSIIRPTHGEIIINGLSTLHDESVKQYIGYVAVETGLYESMTPYEFLYYFGQVHEFSKEKIQSRISELANLLDFNDYLHRKIGKLSTGMKQKISIARGLLHEPQLLILDEPTNGLDIIAAHYVREAIKTIKNTKTSIIISTHIITDIEMCDRLIVLNKGNLVYENITNEIMDKYKSLEELFFDVTRYRETQKNK